MHAVTRLPTARICSTSLRMLKSSSPSCGLSLSASLTCGSMIMCSKMHHVRCYKMQHHKYEHAAFAVPQTLTRMTIFSAALLTRSLGLFALLASGIWKRIA
jgi:hypothetical protein